MVSKLGVYLYSPGLAGFLTDLVKTYGLNLFKSSYQKQVFDAQMSKMSKSPQRNNVKNWIMSPKLSFLNIFTD